MVDGAAIAAVVIAAVAIVATVVLHVLSSNEQKRVRAEAKADAKEERRRIDANADRDRRHVEQLAARVRQEEKLETVAARQEERLQALEVRYAKDTAPAMAQLDAIKMLHQGEALWTALQFVPPAGSSGTPLTQQQLRAADMELLLTEQRARNEIKGFWDDTLRAMHEGMLPPAFGVAQPPVRSSANAAAQPGRIKFGNRGSRWLYRANNFRELVEPFDIANYYRLELDRSSGHYLDGDNRVEIYGRLEHMWRQHCKTWTPPPTTYKSSVAWAEAMLSVRTAPEAAAAAGTPVTRLPPPVLPAGTLPLVHKAL